jgi:hypothetical protein
VLAVLASLEPACGEATTEAHSKSAPPASATTATHAAHASSAPSAATPTNSAAARAPASAAAPAGSSVDLFAGAPAFEGKTTVRSFRGIAFDMPSDFRDFDDATAELVGFNNAPSTIKARFWLSKSDGRNAWATAAKLAETEKLKSAEVTQGGKSLGKATTPSPCESSVFEAVGVQPAKIQWVGEPRDATFGEGRLPGAIFEGKDPDGKWRLYCVRVAISDELGVVGAIGWRTDKGDAEGNAMTNVLKSLRAAK